ncbi:hypothetical protein EVAR_49919_1 [Eumeta japonica]|uniref:Uncharacterized protein n=1 Tax=Eumeta variegata TaxID=151549 RepID=A0A4C1Y556_EUMVA|nr:hypothetical protein EVAR_49919_1 [Eumeta japonica]
MIYIGNFCSFAFLLSGPRPAAHRPARPFTSAPLSAARASVACNISRGCLTHKSVPAVNLFTSTALTSRARGRSVDRMRRIESLSLIEFEGRRPRIASRRGDAIKSYSQSAGHVPSAGEKSTAAKFRQLHYHKDGRAARGRAACSNHCAGRCALNTNEPRRCVTARAPLMRLLTEWDNFLHNK